MPEVQQSLANHRRTDPPFHFFILPVSLISLIAAVVTLFRFPSLGNGWLVVVSVAAVVAVFKIRLYALRVQDRLICLEERLRLMSVLPEPLRARIGELTVAQLIALRFASDTEIPGLTERALQQKLGRDDIKKMIVSWRPDYSRI